MMSGAELLAKWRGHRHTCLWHPLGFRVERYLGWPHPYTYPGHKAGGYVGVTRKPAHLLTSDVTFCPSPFSLLSRKFVIVHDFHPLDVFSHLPTLIPARQLFSIIRLKSVQKRVNSEWDDLSRTLDSERASLKIHGQKVELWWHRSKTWTSFFQH